MSALKKTTYKEYYPCLLRALDATWDGKPVGSDRILAWIVLHEPSVVNGLKSHGYADADDPNRPGWSWRQYLGNALARMSREGRLLLRGHSVDTPDGYFGPVGLWSPLDRDPSDEPARPVSLRMSETVHDRVASLASGHGISLQATVDRLIQAHPGIRLGLAMDRPVDTWLSFLRLALDSALKDADVTLPLPQSYLIWVASALGLRVAAELDSSDRTWSLCARRATIKCVCGPADLVTRAGTPIEYEEDSDLAIFTRAVGRDWPLVAIESEAASWTEVGPDWRNNDYMWDFYKLFRQKAAATVMLARVAGTANQRDAEGRMEQLSETFEGAVLLPFQHLLWVGQPVFVVILPGSNSHQRALIGVAVAPGPMLWEWWSRP